MKTLLELLNSHTLKPYHDKARNIAKLNRIWSIALQDLAKNCKVANFEHGKLVLNVQNAAWATRIRYAVPEILKTISKYSEFATLKNIQCKISHCPTAEDTTIIKRTISPLAHQLLDDVAKSTAHPQLKASLSRLAVNVKEQR